ncbi:MAG: hypothetical protein IKC71_02840 [Clostridia bacterium]|nr:hypothetical protein [Clostridia bacterium]
MKKRFLVLFTLIALICTTLFSTSMMASAAEVWEDVGTYKFENINVGQTSTSAGAYIAVNSGIFSKVGLQGSGKVEIMEEEGEKFARATSSGSSFVALSCIPRENQPITKFKLTITYRFSDGLNFKDKNRGFVGRIWDGNAQHTADKQFVVKSANPADYTDWTTSTVEIETKYVSNSIWFFTFTDAGEYFDVKEVSLTKVGTPVFTERYDYDASKNEDLVVSCDLKGHTITKIDNWSDPDNVKVVDMANYVIANDGKSITFKKEFLQTLKPGAKSLAITVKGLDYIVVVNVYNSTVADAPVKGGVDVETGCGSVIGVTGAILSSVLLAGSIVVFKKKK